MTGLVALTETMFRPVETNELELLFKNYDAALKNIVEVSTIMLERDLSYFYGAHGVQTKTYNENVFSFEPAKKYLDSRYWKKALRLTDVIEFMPANRRDEWHKQLRDCNTPGFTPEAVYETLKQHLADRPKYLAERVENLFKGLSREHVTNRPEGFFKRIILTGVIDGIGLTNHYKKDTIHDLRVIANKFQGRESIVGTEQILGACRRQSGKWLEIDGGLLRIKTFLNGNAHIELDEKVAWELNQCLHFLYPMAIPEKFRKPKKESKPKNYQYQSRFIAPAVLSDISGMRRKSCYVLENDKYGLSEQVREILLALGAVEGKATYKSSFGNNRDVTFEKFTFDYEYSSVIDNLITSGQMPDKVSYQFYPTPDELAQAASKLLTFNDGDKCLEPSAGHGALAKYMPKSTKCLELSPLHCEILTASGFDVSMVDFLEHNNRYDKILMNPPFSKGRAKAHVLHAMELLKSGGQCVAIVPSSHRGYFDLDGYSVTYSDDIKNAFADASVTVIFVTIKRL